uniref:MICOS complex subunit MIC60 n=1 Tax=Caenorhabditis japonica TaxID=281687 RepID=A0A8R1I652_CAEJA
MRSSQQFLAKRMTSSRASGSSGGMKFVGMAMGATAAGAAAVAGYASYDTNFRKQIENSIPGSKPLLNYAIGVEEPKPIANLKELRPLQFSADPKIAPKHFEPKPIEILEKKAIKPAEMPSEKPIKIKKELIGVKVPETPEKPAKRRENPYLGTQNHQIKNESLTESLKNRLTAAENATKSATGAKLETIRAIENHIQTIREAIEAGKDGDWDAVTMAHLKAKRLIEKDQVVENTARNAVAELVTEANFGGQGESTQLNPLIPISKKTAAKLSNELDEMVSNVKYVDSERIFVRDYSDKVAESRKKFMLELKAVHPKLNYEEGIEMKKADLKTILAHAHIRIDQLNQRLIDAKLTEEKRVRTIIDQKKKDLLQKIQIEAEEKAKKTTAPSHIDKPAPPPPVIVKIPEVDAKKLDEELKKATAEIEKQYEKKLEEVVRTQKKLYDIEHAKDVDQAVLKERNRHSKAVGKALAQLEGIEKALAGHLQMDIQNRKSKQMWLATQNLKDTVIFGNRASCCMEGRRAPLGGQIKTLLSCAGNDKFVKTVDSAMSKTSKVQGEYTDEDLNTRLRKVLLIGRRVAYVKDGTNGSGALAHLYSWLKSALTVDFGMKTTSDSITPAAETNITLLKRVEQLWKNGKKADALRLLQKTNGATRRVASDFIEDARRQQETLLLSRLLLAHAALTSIRSTY